MLKDKGEKEINRVRRHRLRAARLVNVALYMVNVAFISERTTERTNAPTRTTWLSVEIQGPWLSKEIHRRYGYDSEAYPRENCIAPDHKL